MNEEKKIGIDEKRVDRDFLRYFTPILGIFFPTPREISDLVKEK